MPFDHLIQNINLPDGTEGVDVGIREDKIIAVEKNLDAVASVTTDGSNCMLSPPFVDSHFHMDATLSLGLPRLNQSGTLLEGIQLWGELKPDLTQKAIKDRALRYCDLAVSQGLLAIRSHVDVCDSRLLAVEALLDVQKQVKPYLDLQLVAFPQDGFYRSENAETNLLKALDLGVEIVGGIPHFERTMEDGRRSVDALCRIAAERGLMVDMHCDESDDPMSRHVESLASAILRFGLQGRVTGSHLTSMHSMDNYYVSKLIPLMAESGMHAIANPLINITIQGRQDVYPKRRGMTRVPELMSAGINVAFGHDCVMDPWYPLGSADMLEVASMGLHVAQMTGVEAMKSCFQAVTANAACIMNLEGYGIKPGCNADLVLLEARDPIEAIRLKAKRLMVMRRGKVIAVTPSSPCSLNLDARRSELDRRFV